jgi:glutathione synthase/RimK-type ligase-like ATP-grasp enzyme
MSNMNQAPQIVGRKVLISFPAHNITDVPAKVDTGADRSAIWASSITESDGVLSYTLFDTSSPCYTGEVIQTKDFHITSIKNSFGFAEFRYRVKLFVILEGRKIRVSFTLADRSRNRYPILIGRRTLQGKFLVDVSRDPIASEKRRALIVSAVKSDNVRKFTEGIEALANDIAIDRTTYDDLAFSIQDNKMLVTVISSGEDIADYDLVHFKTSIQRDITAAFARYAQYKGVRVLDEIVQYFPTTSKLYQYSILHANDIKVPNSLFTTPATLVKSFDLYEKTLALPFVLKGIHASKGEMNEVVRSRADFDRIAKQALSAEQYLIGQAFVPNTGDYRVLVLGRQISMVIYRSRQNNDTHLNNTSQGGDARLVEATTLSSEVQINSIRAAALMQRDVAGVDMVQNEETGEWYCFEVNDGPQLATGAFLKEKRQAFANYLQRELEK